MLHAAGGFTPIGYNRLSNPNNKKLFRHIRAVARRIFETLGPFVQVSDLPIVLGAYVCSIPSNFDPVVEIIYDCYQRPPPQTRNQRSTHRFYEPILKYITKILLLACLILPFASTSATSRLPAKDAFYTQNLGQDSTVIKQLGKNTQLTLKVKTQMYNVLVEKLTIKQKFDYEAGNENKVDLFEQKTNLGFSAYLSVGKDTILRLISNPLDKYCAIDTLTINGDKINIKDKRGNIIEENLQTLLKVKKEGKIYKVEFGFEKEFNIAEDVYKLINLYLNYGEVYQRNLNAIVGEFKKQPLNFLAQRTEKYPPVYEPVSMDEYLHLKFFYDPKLENNSQLYGEDYMLLPYWVISDEPPKIYNWISMSGVVADFEIGTPKEAVIRVGEKYNYLEDTRHDHNDIYEEEIKEMVYIKFSKNYSYYDTTKWKRSDINVSYPWPGVYIRAPPPVFFYFVRFFPYRPGAVTQGPIYFTSSNNANTFYFYQKVLKLTSPPNPYPPAEPPYYPRPPPPLDSVKYFVYFEQKTFIFYANRAKDGVYKWEDSAIVATRRNIITETIDGTNNAVWGDRDYVPRKIPLDSVPYYIIPDNKLSVIFPSRKEIIILDENPAYLTIARDCFIKANNLYVPKDSVPARVIRKEPSDGESGVSPKTYITVKFNEPVRAERLVVKENGREKEGSFTMLDDDSTLVWWPRDLFMVNSKVDYKFEVVDSDTNLTVVEGYFYTEDPSGVEESERVYESIGDLVFAEEARLYDVMGRELIVLRRDEPADIPLLSRGVYFVRVDKSKYHKLIIR